jgi:hypothetical protein
MVQDAQKKILCIFQVREVGSQAFIQTAKTHVRMLIRVRQEMGFPSLTQIWEDSCIRSEDMVTPSGRYP